MPLPEGRVGLGGVRVYRTVAGPPKTSPNRLKWRGRWDYKDGHAHPYEYHLIGADRVGQSGR